MDFFDARENHSVSHLRTEFRSHEDDGDPWEQSALIYQR